jgi:hypothetical protein
VAHAVVAAADSGSTGCGAQTLTVVEQPAEPDTCLLDEVRAGRTVKL